MRMLRFRSSPDDAWTFCSFAGEEESNACTILAGRLSEVYDEVQTTDDETEDWLEVSE
jgi:hypothetical protein